jgi:hypothetical protein
MTERKNGGGAFPNPAYSDGRDMSLRDWFAGNAMNRLLQVGGEAYIKDVPSSDLKFIMAAKAYEMADAMLEARDLK